MKYSVFSFPLKKMPGFVDFSVLLQVVTRFLKLETLLDDSVDQKIELQIERGGMPLTVNLVVRYCTLYSLSLFNSLKKIILDVVLCCLR